MPREPKLSLRNILAVKFRSRDALTKFDGSVFRQQNISGFDIAVNESAAVKILKTVKSLVADCADLLLSEWLLVN